LCVELNHRKEVMVNFVGTLQPAGTVTPGGVDDVAVGVATGVVGGLFDEGLLVELGAGAEVVETQPRS
jgi:hypothetical protein